MSLTLAHVGQNQTIVEIIEINGYTESLALRRTHRDITGITPAPQIGWFWNGSVFAATAPAPNAVMVKSRSAAALTIATQQMIVGGFTSSALGAAHTYPSQATDQSNLLSAATAASVAAAGWTTLLWCATGATWAFTAHTAAQVQQVMLDWIAFRTAQQQALITAIAAL